MAFDINIGEQIDQFRAAYPAMSAAALMGTGAVFGFAGGWLWFRQEIAVYKARLDHADQVIAGKLPPETYKPRVIRRGSRMVAGLILLSIGLGLAAVGTAILFANLQTQSTAIGSAVIGVNPISSEKIATPLGVSTPPAPKVAPIKKEFTNRTAGELLALYEGRTPFQADKLIEPYKGLWIKVHAKVLNIYNDGPPGRSILVLTDQGKTIECRLGEQWASTVARYDKGDTIDIEGRIAQNQNGSQLYLHDCAFP